LSGLKAHDTVSNLIGGLLLFVFLSFTGCAGDYFYYPETTIYQVPSQKHYTYEDVVFESIDGTKLHGWFLPASGKAKATVLHLHGNAQNISAHYEYAGWLVNEGFNVFTFDYRGYGRSQGKPDRKGVYEDCIAAFYYISKRKDVDRNRLIVFGQSLGGANAIAALGATRFEGVRAVVIDSSFYSYRSIVAEKINQKGVLSFILSPLAALSVSNDYSPSEGIAEIKDTPILFIHGTEDTVISHKHSEKLYEAANEPKEIWSIEGGRHTEAFAGYNSIFRKRLVGFFNEALKKKSDL
jgi:hypothetical protein